MVDLIAFGDRKQMIFVYVIKSKCKNFRYVGITNDLKRRLQDHNAGKNISTRAYKPFDVIHSECYENYVKARVREKFFKSGQGRKYLDEICPGGGIGRRKRLKIVRGQPHESSILSPGTR